MRSYPGVDLNGLPPSKERWALQAMDTWIKDAQKAISAPIVATGGGGGAPVGASYIVTSADPTLTAEKVLVTTSPLTGAVGAGTVTLGAPTVVVGPGSATSGNVVIYDGSTGKLVKDLGLAAATVVSGPGSSTDGDIATFNGTSGITIADSGLKTSNLDSFRKVITSEVAVGPSDASEVTIFSIALPSGLLDVAGTTLRVDVMGKATTNSTPPNMTWTLYYGATVVTSPPAMQPQVSMAAEHFNYHAMVTTYSSGHVRTGSFVQYYESIIAAWRVGADTGTGSNLTPTTSGSVTVKLTAQWASSNASNSLTVQQAALTIGVA